MWAVYRKVNALHGQRRSLDRHLVDVENKVLSNIHQAHRVKTAGHGIQNIFRDVCSAPLYTM